MKLVCYQQHLERRKVRVNQNLQDIVASVNSYVSHRDPIQITSYDELKNLTPAEFELKVSSLQQEIVSVINSSRSLSTQDKYLLLQKALQNPKKSREIILELVSVLILIPWFIAVLTFFSTMMKPVEQTDERAIRVWIELSCIIGLASGLDYLNKYLASKENIWQDPGKLEDWLNMLAAELAKHGLNTAPAERHALTIAQV